MYTLTHALATVLALAAGAAPALQDSDLRFEQHALAVGPSPYAMAAGDLDRDGHIDLIVVNEDGLMLLAGDGEGGLERLGQVSAGRNPVGLALADLDGDGDLDIAGANHETDYVTLLWGDGRGSFPDATRLTVPIGPHPHAVRTADLNGDGHIDLAVDDREGEGVRVIYGRGDGRFDLPGTHVDAGGDPYRGMAVGDVNGDGRPDIVTPNPRSVGVVLQGADGFQPPFTITAPSPFAVALADLNGDANLDIVSASESGAVRAFLGDGRGGFETGAASSWQMGPGGKNAVSGDFNGDGIGDVAIAGWFAPRVFLLLGGLDGITTAEVEGGENPWALAAADLNEDGRDDLIVADNARPQARLYLTRARQADR